MKPYDGPTCPQKNCGACYKVTSKGGYSGEGQGSGLIKKNGSVYVQIIDACPSKSAENTCKGTGPNQIKPEERCSVPASGTPINQLDIDYAAYQQLTGTHRDAVSAFRHPCVLSCLLFRVWIFCFAALTSVKMVPKRLFADDVLRLPRVFPICPSILWDQLLALKHETRPFRWEATIVT